MPRVSVLLPCHNAACYLVVCLDSLLKQEYTDFEIVAMDDGSTDETSALLTEYGARDPRIRPFRNERNLGIVAALNRGLTLARGEYLARMDADDEALPERLGKQAAFLDAQTGVDIVSSSVILIDERGRALGRRDAWATRPAACRFVTCFAPPVIHPAAMMRRALMQELRYSEAPSAQHVEDYDLWSRAVRSGHRVANLPEALLRLRVSASSVSRRHEATQVENFLTCVEVHLRSELDEEPPRSVVRVLANRVDLRDSRTPLAASGDILLKLVDHALAQAASDPSAQSEIVAAARLQRLEVLIQCLLKGTPWLRLRAIYWLLRDPAVWLGARSRQHLASKLRTRARRRQSL